MLNVDVLSIQTMRSMQTLHLQLHLQLQLHLLLFTIHGAQKRRVLCTNNSKTKTNTNTKKKMPDNNCNYTHNCINNS